MVNYASLAPFITLSNLSFSGVVSIAQSVIAYRLISDRFTGALSIVTHFVIASLVPFLLPPNLRLLHW